MCDVVPFLISCHICLFNSFLCKVLLEHNCLSLASTCRHFDYYRCRCLFLHVVIINYCKHTHISRLAIITDRGVKLTAKLAMNRFWLMASGSFHSFTFIQVLLCNSLWTHAQSSITCISFFSPASPMQGTLRCQMSASCYEGVGDGRALPH